MGLLHRCVLDLTRLELKDLLGSVPNHAINEKDAEGQTPLYWAARRGDVQAVSLLLGAGADQNSKNNRGSTILTAAIMSGNTGCIWKILQSERDINHRQKNEYTPLHHCCRHDVDISIIKALLDRGADLNAQTALGHTALMIATFNTRTPIAEFLINNHAQLNIQGKDGASALHFAVMSGDFRTVRHLLSNGANHLLKTVTNDETVLHILARRKGDCETVRALQLFDLRDLNVDDVTRREGLTALQIAEMNSKSNSNVNANTNSNKEGGCESADAEWLELFRDLVEKIHSRGGLVSEV